MKRLLFGGWLTFGIAVLCLTARIVPLVSFHHVAVYHFDGDPKVLFLPILLDIGVLWILLTGVFLVVPDGRHSASLRAALLLASVWILLKVWSVSSEWTLPHWLSLTLASLPLLSALGFSLFWGDRLQSYFERVSTVINLAFSLISFNAVIAVALLLLCWWNARRLNDLRQLHRQTARAANPRGPARVIVILLDELSYQQVYGNRSPNLALPAFDAWASTSTVFGAVRPAARFTEKAVPAMLTGWPVADIASSADGRSVALQVDHRWLNLDPQDTFLGDAVRQGYSTGIAGWYIPYCRILAQVLDRCFWTNRNMLPAMSISEDASILANTLAPVPQLLHQVPVFLLPRRKPFDPTTVTQHIRDYNSLYNAADALLLDSNTSFVFLHLPIPHPVGIYNRKTHRFATQPTSYLDNLALADTYLAHVHQLLQSRNQWESSAIVVTGDHSWRTWLWVDMAEWTTEEDVAEAHRSRGFDDRPALLVKLPYQNTATRIDTPFEATHFRSLIGHVMAGQIKTGSDLENWVQAGASDPRAQR